MRPGQYRLIALDIDGTAHKEAHGLKTWPWALHFAERCGSQGDVVRDLLSGGYTLSPYRWHLTCTAGATASICGISTIHCGMARGQRGWNGQPLGW